MSGLQHRLLVAGLALLALGALAHLGRAGLPLASAAVVLAIGAHAGLLGAVVLGATGLLGWVTRVARFDDVTRLLDEVPWRGDEVVVDVGCGEGLAAIRVARRVPRGRVIALDDWQRPHGTRAIGPDVLRQNAAAEGLASRIEVRTAGFDAFGLADASADVVVANFSLHHLDGALRAAAVREIGRVLRPGGVALLAEPRHRGELARGLAAAGLTDIERKARTFPRGLFAWVIARRPRSAVAG